MRYGQIVIGPAGSGKSTYCNAIYQHGQVCSRNVKVVNLDPAADHFNYACYADLISVDDVLKDRELQLGPNGALVFCMEYVAEHLEWLKQAVGEGEDDYFLFDCPGQIELYTHCSATEMLLDALKAMDFNLCAVFVLDTQFLLDVPKFLSGSLVALSTMVKFELPHVNVLSKMDLLSPANRQRIEAYIETDPRLLETVKNVDRFSAKYQRLTAALSNIIEDYSLIKYVPLDITDEESVSDLLLIIDNTIQYGENLEVKDRLNNPGDED